MNLKDGINTLLQAPLKRNPRNLEIDKTSPFDLSGGSELNPYDNRTNVDNILEAYDKFNLDKGKEYEWMKANQDYLRNVGNYRRQLGKDFLDFQKSPEYKRELLLNAIRDEDVNRKDWEKRIRSKFNKKYGYADDDDYEWNMPNERWKNGMLDKDHLLNGVFASDLKDFVNYMIEDALKQRR